MTYRAVISADQVPPGTIRCVSVNGLELVLVHEDGNLHALQRRCPHMGADLGAGRLDAGRLVCPKHAAAFDLSTGSAVAGPKIILFRMKTKDAVTYLVRLRDGMVEVDC